MRRYELASPILLSFHDGREQYDAMIKPEDKAIIEIEGNNLYVLLGGKRILSNVYPAWALGLNCLKEIENGESIQG